MIKVYKDISQLATLEGAYQKDGRNLNPQDLTLINDGCVVFDSKEILWVGKSSDIPKDYSNLPYQSMKGKTLTPEIVDSHTHLIFGGDRSEEYAMRLNGEDYQKIAEAGGGILSTSRATNNLSSQELFKLCCQRIERIYSYGIGTIEIKSGYGLNLNKEKELTLIIDKLKKHYTPKIQIFNTFMPAHAVAPGFKTGSEYIEKVVFPLLEELAPIKIIDAVDIFHEKGYFNSQDVVLLFEEAKRLGLKIKSHADEFQNNNGALLASSYQAVSADHLLRISEEGIKELSQSKTVATLLPGTAFFLGKEQVNARKLLDKGVKVAMASDYNPGSCHCDNLLLLASLAAPTYKMNICELWSAITLNSAHALGLKKQGAVIKGLKPRFSLFDTKNLSQITYSWGRNFSLNHLFH